MDDPRKKFGERVRHHRKMLDWSQEDLANEAGLDRTYIGSVERGERNISLINIVKIAQALGYHHVELLDFSIEDRL